MSDEPKTGAEAVMRLSIEQNRLEARDRAVAVSVAREMMEQYFDPASIEDMSDIRWRMERAAQHAAYEAIQRERENHKNDMKLIEHFAQMRHDLLVSGMSFTRIAPEDIYEKPEAPTIP